MKHDQSLTSSSSLTPSRTKAEINLVLVTILWGSTFFLTKILLQDVSPFLYIALRFTIASVLFGVIYFRRLTMLSRDAVIKGSILGVMLFLGFIFQSVGLKLTTASKSAFITGLSVLFTPLLHFLLKKRIPKPGNIIGVIIVAFGLYIMTSPEGSSINIGDGMTMICAFLFACYIIYMDVYGQDHDPVDLSFMQFITTSILSIVLLPFLEHPMIQVSNSFIVILLYLAIFPTIIALFVQAKYQRFTTPTRTAVIFSLEPPTAAAFAMIAGQESLTMSIVTGGCLILSGVLVSELSDFKIKNK